MDTLTHYRHLIETILTNHASVPYAYDEIETETVFDRERDHYLLMNVGGDGRRVHGALVHIDIRDGKIWILRDGTERGIAYKLEEAGIPRNQIVLGFHEPTVRPHTGFAVS
jgi:hypothetical protein